MKCPACGVEVVADAKFCHKCGAAMKPATADIKAAPGSDSTPGYAHGPTMGVSPHPETPERDIWRGSYSPKAMIGHWVAAGLVSIALLVLGFMFDTHAIWICVWVAIPLIWLSQGLLLLYRKLSNRYELTTHRFIHESGILWRLTNRMQVIEIDDITFEQGPIERMTGTGTLRLISADRTSPDLHLYGIDKIQQVSVMFDDARREERRRRGLYMSNM